jgi:2-iminobutanoate/2-iminopropanoate deaminase
MHEIIHSDHAPKAVGPYSQAIATEKQRMIFVSGQIPFDPKTMALVSSDVREQTRQVLKNVDAVLKAAKVGREHVVKTTVFIQNMNDFAAINEEYAAFFGDHRPARACVEVARLPKDALVEIDAIAIS